MKNIVVKILVSLVVLYHIGFTVSVSAADATNTTSSVNYENGSDIQDSAAQKSTSSSTSTAPTTPKTMNITTTEKVPGAKCECIDNSTTGSDGPREPCKNVATRKYSCEVGVGFSQFQIFFGSIIRMVINITILLGVLAVVGLGIAWSLAGGDDVKAKSSLKSWAINIIAGVVILFFFRYILMFLAPWIYN